MVYFFLFQNLNKNLVNHRKHKELNFPIQAQSADRSCLNFLTGQYGLLIRDRVLIVKNFMLDFFVTRTVKEIQFMTRLLLAFIICFLLGATVAGIKLRIFLNCIPSLSGHRTALLVFWPLKPVSSDR